MVVARHWLRSNTISPQASKPFRIVLVLIFNEGSEKCTVQWKSWGSPWSHALGFTGSRDRLTCHIPVHSRFCRHTTSCDTLSSLENHRLQSHLFSVIGAAKILGFSSSLCLVCVLSDAGSIPKMALCHRNIEREVKRKLWKIETTTAFCSMDKNRMECAYLILGIQYESTANV